MSELGYFSRDLPRNWTGLSEQISGSGIDSGSGVLVVPLDPLSLVRAVICKPSFTSQKTLLVELAEALFDKVELAASSEKEATEEKVFREVSKNGVLKTIIMQSLSDT